MMTNDLILLYCLFGPMALFCLIVLGMALYREIMEKRKSYNVFFDDIRTLDMVYPGQEEKFDFVVRTIDEFKEMIELYGIPSFVSFDHDLGLNKDGSPAEVYEVIKWIVYEKELDISEMDFAIHSDNPVGAENIESLLNNWKKELKRRKNE